MQHSPVASELAHISTARSRTYKSYSRSFKQGSKATDLAKERLFSIVLHNTYVFVLVLGGCHSRQLLSPIPSKLLIGALATWWC